MDVIEKINEYMKKKGPDWYIRNSHYYKNVFHIGCHTAVLGEIIVEVNCKFIVDTNGNLKHVYYDCKAYTYKTDEPAFTRVADDINMIFKAG